MRLSYVIHAMRTSHRVGTEVPTIKSIYRDGSREGGSGYEWISESQDLCDVDFPERSFVRAIEDGADITKYQVLCY